MVESSDYSLKGASHVLRTAVHSVLTDDGFQVPSSSALKAVQTAQHLVSCLDNPENAACVKSFADELVAVLKSCFEATSSRHPMESMHREKLWRAFHQLRSSPVYKGFWCSFLQSRECEGDPIFYQYVSDTIFKELVKEQYPLPEGGGEHVQRVLSYEEKNAIRYTAGYIPRALRKKIERSTHPLMEELVLCLLDLTEEDGDDAQDESSDWINAVDRGGLKHVSDMMYSLIASMELEVQKHLSLDAVEYPPNIKDTLTGALTANEDVQFYWSILSANWEEDESQALLPMIVNMWITIRGFAFTSAWMERYKHTRKKTVQKSKGVRKTLVSTKSK